MVPILLVWYTNQENDFVSTMSVVGKASVFATKEKNGCNFFFCIYQKLVWCYDVMISLAQSIDAFQAVVNAVIKVQCLRENYEMSKLCTLYTFGTFIGACKDIWCEQQRCRMSNFFLSLYFKPPAAKSV